MGRSSGCTFTIDQDQAGDRIVSISKVHFEIKRTADGVKITDKSSNGTFVNKKPIGKGKFKDELHLFCGITLLLLLSALESA